MDWDVIKSSFGQGIVDKSGIVDLLAIEAASPHYRTPVHHGWLWSLWGIVDGPTALEGGRKEVVLEFLSLWVQALFEFGLIPSELPDETGIWVDYPSIFANVFESLFEAPAQLFHEIADDNGGWSGYSCETMNKDISVLQTDLNMLESLVEESNSLFSYFSMFSLGLS